MVARFHNKQEELEFYSGVYKQGQAAQFIKTVRFDEDDFNRTFIMGLMERAYLKRGVDRRKIRVQLRRAKGSATTKSGVFWRPLGDHDQYKVTRNGIIVNTSSNTDDPQSYKGQFSPEKKEGKSKKQSVSVVSLEQEYFPPAFGHETRSELTGIIFFSAKPEEDDHVLSSIQLLYDGGTANRPYYKGTKEEAQQYYDGLTKEKIWHSTVDSLIKAGLASSQEKKHNEILARLEWLPNDPRCHIGVFSDTLKSKLIAQLRAIDWKLNTTDPPSLEQFIPISFYLPENQDKKIFPYLLNEQQQDLQEALSNSDPETQAIALIVHHTQEGSKINFNQLDDTVKLEVVKLLFSDQKFTSLAKIKYWETLFGLKLDFSSNLNIHTASTMELVFDLWNKEMVFNKLWFNHDSFSAQPEAPTDDYIAKIKIIQASCKSFEKFCDYMGKPKKFEGQQMVNFFSSPLWIDFIKETTTLQDLKEILASSKVSAENCDQIISQHLGDEWIKSNVAKINDLYDLKSLLSSTAKLEETINRFGIGWVQSLVTKIEDIGKLPSILKNMYTTHKFQQTILDGLKPHMEHMVLQVDNVSELHQLTNVLPVDIIKQLPDGKALHIKSKRDLHDLFDKIKKANSEILIDKIIDKLDSNDLQNLFASTNYNGDDILQLVKNLNQSQFKLFIDKFNNQGDSSQDLLVKMLNDTSKKFFSHTRNYDANIYSQIINVNIMPTASMAKGNGFVIAQSIMAVEYILTQLDVNSMEAFASNPDNLSLLCELLVCMTNKEDTKDYDLSSFIKKLNYNNGETLKKMYDVIQNMHKSAGALPTINTHKALSLLTSELPREGRRLSR